MKLPQSYVPHLDHRITVLMTFTVRRDAGFFGSDHGEPTELGDVYRASLEGAGIMLRMLLEFLGVKAKRNDPRKLTQSGNSDATQSGNSDAVLGQGVLAHIDRVDINELDASREELLARMHDEASKRTAHPAFNKVTVGLNPVELREATKWVVNEIWDRCYDPEAVTVHRDLFRLLEGGKWEGIPFKPAS